MNLFVEGIHVVKAITPSADVYNGNPTSDVINMQNFKKAVFVLHQKSSTSNTGTASVKPQAVENVSGSSAEDLPFKYSKMTTGASDVMGAITAVAAGSTFTTTANEDTAFVIEVDASDLPEGKPFLQLKLTEVVNDPVVGSCMCYLIGSRHGYPFETALA